MTIKHAFTACLLAFCSISPAYAQEGYVKTFNAGSYPQILRENAAQPFVLALWSLDCPSCIKDMAVLAQVKENHPQLKIIMLSTDEPAATTEVKNMLARQNLSGLESWIFGSEDAQKLRYEIDPSWFGELPRTYFFDKTHNRVGKSGALRMDEFQTQIKRIIP